MTVTARTWVVDPGGPGDALTILQGINLASAGDTVMVTCGNYYENGIYMKHGIYLTGGTGMADCVTIGGEGAGGMPGRISRGSTTSMPLT